MDYKFNINHHVKVKLTPQGFLYWKLWHDNRMPPHWTRPLEEYTSRVDKDGYTEFQLLNLMEIFGGAVGLGKELLFDADIIFKSRDLYEIETQ